MKPFCILHTGWNSESHLLTNIQGTLNSLFWTLFGYKDLSTSIFLDNCPEKQAFVSLVCPYCN